MMKERAKSVTPLAACLMVRRDGHPWSSHRAVEMAVLPRALLSQLFLLPRGGIESSQRQGRQIDGWGTIDDPSGERLPQRGRDREPCHIAPAREEEAAHCRSGTDDMLTIRGDSGNATTMLANLCFLQDWQLER